MEGSPTPSRYWSEISDHARPIAAATLGIAFGMAINTYTAGLFGAYLIKDFGWERSQFAIVGSFAVIMLVLLPIVGRITDRFGVRFAATIGIVGLPLTYIALSRMNGDFNLFLAITLLQMVIASFTTSVVFNRVVVERLVSARGMGFAIVMSGPPLAGAIAAPILGDVIAAYGWRTGYVFLGVLCLAMGLIALAFLPPTQKRDAKPSTLRADFALVSRSKVFWLLMGGMLLCNLPQALGASQQMMLLLENGIPITAAGYLSIYPAGVILGRFATGAALDKFPAHIVGAIGLALPAIGFALLASPWDSGGVIAVALMLMGLAQGAEGDVAAYIVGERFPMPIFASTVGLVGGATALGTSMGALIIAAMLKQWGSFTPFVILSAVATLLGAAAIILIGRKEAEGAA